MPRHHNYSSSPEVSIRALSLIPNIQATKIISRTPIFALHVLVDSPKIRAHHFSGQGASVRGKTERKGCFVLNKMS